MWKEQKQENHVNRNNTKDAWISNENSTKRSKFSYYTIGFKVRHIEFFQPRQNKPKRQFSANTTIVQLRRCLIISLIQPITTKKIGRMTSQSLKTKNQYGMGAAISRESIYARIISRDKQTYTHIHIHTQTHIHTTHTHPGSNISAQKDVRMGLQLDIFLGKCSSKLLHLFGLQWSSANGGGG